MRTEQEAMACAASAACGAGATSVSAAGSGGVRSRPILFRPELVREILAGRKTVTRRPVKTEIHHVGPGGSDTPADWGFADEHGDYYLLDRSLPLPGRLPADGSYRIPCPYGEPGDRLWVRETWSELIPEHYPERWLPRDSLSDRYGTPRRNGAAYLADSLNKRGEEDGDSKRCRLDFGYKWRPAIHMPRWACRLVLTVTGVRVERLRDITEEQAKAEGVTPFPLDPEGDCWTDGKHRTAFEHKWRTIYGWGDEPLSWNANPWVWVVSFARAFVR